MSGRVFDGIARPMPALAVLLGLALLVVIGPRLHPDADALARVALKSELPAALGTLAADGTPHAVQLRVTGTSSPEALERELARAIGAVDGLKLAADSVNSAPILSATLDATAAPPTLKLTLEDGGAFLVRGVPPPTWLALLPPYVAILLAFSLRRTIPALLAGVWAGAVAMAGGGIGQRLIQGSVHLLTDYVIRVSFFDYDSLLQPHTWTRANFQLQIILFVLGLIGTVGIANRSGGIAGVMRVVLKTIHGARSAMIATYALGIAIFFDDYSNTLIVGNTMRPLTDRLRISREKLAYVVDSTAAPVAGISILSTWVAYEISLFAAPAAEIGLGDNAYAIFLRTIPFRFYCLATLLFVALLVFSNRDFGPMLKAERRARRTGAVIRPGGEPTISAALDASGFQGNGPARWFNAVGPIAMVLAATAGWLWWTGRSALTTTGLPGFWTLDYWRAILENADSAKALCIAAWTGFASAFVLATSQRILSPLEALRAGISSFGAVTNAIVILILAWAIGAVCRDLMTAQYLIALLEGHIPPLVFPAGLFLLSCVVSFSTGSSWSTMSIVLPNTIFLAHAIGANSAIGAEAMTIVSIGAVLEGSIFGDHCSPISDTTILSSTASGSDHIDHVRTQLPYAVTVMLVALGCGYIPAAAGIPALVSWTAGALVLFLIVRLVGKNPETPTPYR